MAKTVNDNNNNNLEGLEIISIGVLYSGIWDKKYWSSSRGKDRYPFPIGYKALRNHNGIKYHMEIHEGPKGPSFSITSSDGYFCSEQTPDMAWDIFQKKGCPGIKLWRGKRYSCKIDGFEFFGFKNAFVQRLLRELASHDGVTTKQCDNTSGSINEDSAKKNQSPCSELCSEATNPAPLTNLAMPLVKGKRSRRLKNVILDPVDVASCKKIKTEDIIPIDRVSHEDEVQGNGTSNLVHKSQNVHKDEISLIPSASNEELGFHNDDRASVISMNSETAVVEKSNSFPDNDGLPVISCHSSDHNPKDEASLYNEDKVVNYVPTGTTGTLPAYENPPGRSIPQNEEPDLSVPEEPKDGQVSDAKDTKGIKDVDMCVPDSLEFSLDTASDSKSNSQKESPFGGKCELVAEIGSVTISGIIASEPHQEKETSTLNVNSQKSDSDSVGEDIMKSMMSFLLPQALPLLSSKKKSSPQLITYSRRKKRVVKPPEFFLGREQIQKENKGPENLDNVSPDVGVPAKNPLLDRGEIDRLAPPNQDQGLDVLSSGKEATIVPDNFINDEACSDTPQADLGTIDDVKNRTNKLQLLAGSTALDKSLMSHAGSSFSDKACEGQKESIEKCENVIRSESVLGNLSSMGNNVYKSKDNMCINSDELSSPEIHFKEKELRTSIEHNKGATDNNSAAKVSSCENLHKGVKISGLTGDSSITENPNAGSLARRNEGPLSENSLQSHAASKLMLPSDFHSVSSLDLVGVGNTDNISKQQELGCPMNNQVNLDLLDQSASFLRRSEASVNHPNHIDDKNILEKLAASFSGSDGEVAEDPWLKLQLNMEHSDEDVSIHSLGRYGHLYPISFVLLNTNGEEVRICVLCGGKSDQERNLFMYKFSMKEQRAGYPSFIGYTNLFLPSSRDAFGREVSMDKTRLQLTPDGHSLVLFNSVKAPCCRELCAACTPSCNENAGLKVIQVHDGYVSVVMKLMAAESVQCILVCKPNYLIGYGKSGILHLWVMNSTWSAMIEECDISTSDCISPCIVELKKIPNSAALVLGHNGFGDFGLWDISKRIFVARFSSPSTSVFQFLPISVFCWQNKDSTFTKPHSRWKEKVTENMASTSRALSKQDKNQSYNPMDGEDVAIWILISTICNSDTQHEFRSSDLKKNAGGLWRLALVVENRVIMGSVVEHSATAIGASTGHGIVGTKDGKVYMWDLSTGDKIYDLHPFEGGASCIATDDSKLSPIAVAAGDQLRIYAHSKTIIWKQRTDEQ